MARTTRETRTTPAAILRALIARYPARDQAVIKSVRAAVRKRVPTANELVYDYSGSLVLSYTPTEHGKDGVLSLAVKPDGVRLYFGGGPRLPDPTRLLQGTGGARYILVDGARRLADPEVKALVTAAIARAKPPLPRTGRGELLDRSAAQQKRKGTK